jgi:CHAT domain-containing protein
LYTVPFAALRDPNTGLFLSETKRIRLAPSLITLKSLQKCPEDYHCKKGALIVGDPDVGEVMFRGEKTTFPCLPSAQREAIVIGANLNAEPLIGSQATKEMVKQKLRGGVAVIHIAAHGSADGGQIALAPPTPAETTSIPEEQDYMLTMSEVQEIGVRAQLVVLSCCHSGRGEIRSEGIVGMSRAFLAAGARAVVASLWAIDDDATLNFMLSFYKHLKMGERASRSLQQAMKEMREEGYDEPRHWAPFFLIGDDVTISF